MLIAENVKGLRKFLPVLEAEYGKAGYRCHAQLFNSKYWSVPQNRERYIVVGTLDTLPDTYQYPEEQHDFVPKLSTVLESNVPENFYIADDKARKIIDQALQRLSEMGNVHATITPDRVDKRQNGRRAKEDQDPMFTLTAQDLHGVIIDDTYGYEDKDRVYTDTTPTLRQSRQGVKVIEGQITEVCVNDRGFVDKPPQVSEIIPTLRAENHGNHPKVIERERESRGLEQAINDGIGIKQRNKKGDMYKAVAPTLLATDYKGPHYILERRKED